MKMAAGMKRLAVRNSSTCMHQLLDLSVFTQERYFFCCFELELLRVQLR